MKNPNVLSTGNYLIYADKWESLKLK